MVRTILAWIVAAVIAVSALPWAWQMVSRTVRVHILHARDPLPMDPTSVLIGLLVGVGLMFWKKPNWFLHTFIHESCHALMCMLLFVPVNRFVATRGKGGEVEHDRPDPIRETLIAIAPYTVPLFLIPCLLLVRLVHEGPWRCLGSGLSGFAYIHHLHGLYHNLRLNWRGPDSDIGKVRLPLAIMVIAVVLLLVTTWVVTLLWW